MSSLGSDRQANPFPLDEPNQLFRNLGDGRFRDVSADSGSIVLMSEISRGAVVGDIDNDGDLDIVVTNNSGRARVWRNNADVTRPWVGLRLVVADGGRDAVGAVAAVAWRGKAPVLRSVRADGGYASARDMRVVAALDSEGEGPVDVTIRWPGGGGFERFLDVPLRRYTTLRKGLGESQP